jgi:hypothetical protein
MLRYLLKRHGEPPQLRADHQQSLPGTIEPGQLVFPSAAPLDYWAGCPEPETLLRENPFRRSAHLHNHLRKRYLVY